MRIYETLSEMEGEVARVNVGAEVDIIPQLEMIAFRPATNSIAGLDPFSPAYKSFVLEVYRSISKRSFYDPQKSELAPYLNEISGLHPGPYRQRSTKYLGEHMMAVAQVLAHLDAGPGQRILEYGAGEGWIAIEAAKVGCDVTVVDIEQRYLDIVSTRAKAAEVSVRTVRGEFGYRPDGGRFDRILFYEAFHHALDHAQVAHRMYDMLTPDGFIVFAGEPIIDKDSPWRQTLAYPWGLRLDGLSFRAIQSYGWLELGFDENYFIEMMMRAGFLVEFHPSTATTRGSAYIAKPYGNEIALGNRDMHLAAWDRHGDWHAGEGEHRWTAAEEAVIPIRPDGRMIVVTIKNHLGVPMPYEVETAEKATGAIPPGEAIEVRLPPSERIYLRSPLRLAGPADNRMIGLSVHSVRFE